MKVTHIYSLPNGDSAFQDLKITLIDQGKFGLLSEPVKGPGLVFREMPSNYDSSWHVVPQALYLVILEGQVKISAWTGEVRHLGPGSIIFAEDISGNGHRTESVSSSVIKSMLYKIEK